MSENQKAIKSGAWYTAANFLTRSVGLITTPIFTRLLTHEEFGLFNNFTSWVSILTILVTLNLESTFISAKYDYKDDFDGYASSVLLLSSISCFFAGVVLNAFYTTFQSALGMSRVYVNAMLAYLLFLPAVNLFQAKERYSYRYKTSVALSLVITIGSALLSVILVTQLVNKLDGRVYGYIVPTILIGAILYAIIIRKGKKVRISYWKYAIKICLPYIPHLLSMSVLNSVDRIMINNICGAEDNALYSLAYNCGSVISILIVSLNTAFAPWLGDKLHSKQYSEINAFAKKYITFFFILAVGMMIFSPEILLVLGGRSYLDAVYVMPPIACGCIYQFLYCMFVNVEQFSKKTVGMAIASTTAALLNYGLNLVFIPVYGYVAAAYTTLAGFLWLLLAHMFIVYRYGLKMVYPYRFIGFAALAAVLITTGVNVLYYFNTVRYLLGAAYLAGICVFMYKKKEEIFSWLKQTRKSH